MSDHRNVPIKDKKTGATSFGTSARAQTAGVHKNVNRRRHSEALEDSSVLLPQPAEMSSADTDAIGDGQREGATQNEREGGDAKRPPRHQIENLEQFIAHAYARRGQRVVLPPPLENLLCKHPRLDDEARARLYDLARDDILLAVPRQLLLAFRDVTGFPMLKNVVREFVAEVLVRHPVFSRTELYAALKNLPESVEPDQAFALAATVDSGAVGVLMRDKSLPPKALQELRANATYCLAVWFTETRGIGLDRLSQGLFRALWKPAADGAKTETARLRFLTEIRDLSGVGLAASSFKQQADGHAANVLVANRAREVLQEQNQALHEEVAHLRAELSERDKRIADLDQALTREKEDHDHTRIHLSDDYEQLRTRLLRRLKGEMNLLADGLHALRRDPPKTYVMDDHAERALDGLKKEIRRLESED